MQLQSHPLRSVASLVLFIAACGIPPSNPYDPDTPPAEQARATLSGRVLLEDGASPAGIEVRLVDETGVERASRATNDDGAFLLSDVTRGVYFLRVGAPARYRAPDLLSLPVELNAGEARNLGELRFGVPDTGTASIRGAVLVQSAGIGGATVRAVRRTAAGLEVVGERTSDADGSFALEGLPPGQYAVTADLSGYTPDYKTQLAPLGDGHTIELSSGDELTLHPVTSVLRPALGVALDGESAPAVQLSGGVFYTSSSRVPVDVLAFGGVNRMRLAANALFVDEDGVTLPFVDFNASAEIPLPAAEGIIDLFAQFEQSAEGFTFVTPAFSGRVVRDATPPLLQRAILRGAAVITGEAATWIRGDESTVTVELEGSDVHSAVAGVAVYHDDTLAAPEPAELAFDVVDAPGGLFRHDAQVTLTPGEGEKRVWVFLQDRAGNVSAPYFVSAIVDATPPELGSPPLIAASAEGGALRDTIATLRFAVAMDDAGVLDEPPVRMRVGQAPLPPTGVFEPFSLEKLVTVSGSHGSVVSFAALVEDAAGNQALVESPLYTLDLSGLVVGRVRLEGTPATSPEHGDVLVELFAPGADPEVDADVDNTFTSADGSFALGPVAEGSGYTLRLSRSGARAKTESVPPVVRGVSTQMGTLELLLARGNVAGRFLRGDVVDVLGVHGGILVIAELNGATVAQTVTGPDGSFAFPSPGLPVTAATSTYVIRAVLDGYVSGSVPGVQVAEDATTTVPDEQLPALEGDFDLCEASDLPIAGCVPRAYTNASALNVKLRSLDGVTHVRTSAGVPLDEGDTGTPPFVAVDQADAFTVDVSQLTGAVEVYVQVQSDDAFGAVMSSAIIVDRTAPHAPSVTIAPGEGALAAGYTSFRDIALTFSAQRAAGGETESGTAPLYTVDVSSSPDMAQALTLGHFTGGTFTLPDGVDGTRMVYATFCDRAGNCTATPTQASVVLDREAPLPSSGAGLTPLLTIDLGGAATPTGVVVEDASENRYLTRVVRTLGGLSVGEARVDGSPSGALEVGAYRVSLSAGFIDTPLISLVDVAAPNTQVTVPLPEIPLSESTHVVYVQLVDLAGNRTASPVTDADRIRMTLDLSPPGGSVSLAGGAEWANDDDVLAAFTTDTTGGAVEMQLAVEEPLPVELYSDGARDPFPGATPVAVVLPGADGKKTVRARLFDRALNHAIVEDSVCLDRQPPANLYVGCATCTGEKGGVPVLSSASGQVVLQLAATDPEVPGCASAVAALSYTVKLVSSGALVSSGTLDPGPFREVQLPVGGSGVYDVTVTFSDRASNPASATVRIENDLVAPTFSAAPGLAALDGGLLSAGTTLSSTSQRTYITGSGAVTAVVDTSAGCSAVPQAFASPLVTPLQLPPPNGAVSFYARLSDEAGNASACTASRTYYLDTLSPSVAVTLAGGAEVVASTELAIGLEVDDNSFSFARPVGLGGAHALTLEVRDDLEFGDGNGVITSVSTAGSAAKTYSVPPCSAAEGSPCARRVFVRLSDEAGNSVTTSERVWLDQDPPVPGTPAVVIAGGAAYTNTVSVNVQLRLDNARATDRMQVGCDGTAADEPVVSYAQNVTCLLPAGDGAKTVSVIFSDEVGNTAPAQSDTIVLDTTAPTAPVLVTFAQIVDAPDVTSLEYPDGRLFRTELAGGGQSSDPGCGATTPGCVSYEILGGALTSFEDCASPSVGSCSLASAPFSFVYLLAQDRENALRVRAVDRAGNISEEAAVVITEDSIAPAAPATVLAEAGNGDVLVSWSPSTASDLQGYRVYYGATTSLTGTNADQGASGIDVAANTTFRLTGLTHGAPVYVGVSAYDKGGLESPATLDGPVTPNEVAPNVTATIPHPTGARFRALQSRDGILYAAHGCRTPSSCTGAGFSTYDVADPSSPVLLDTCDDGFDYAIDFALVGDHVYLANGPTLDVIDVSDPKSLACGVSKTTVSAGGTSKDWATGVDFAGGYLYVAQEAAGLTVWDVTINHTSPSYVASYTTGFTGTNDEQGARVVRVHGDYAYVLQNFGQVLTVLDVRAPATPQLAGRLSDGGGVYADVAVAGDRVFLLENNSLRGYHLVPSTTSPPALSTSNAFVSRFVSRNRSMALAGPYLYTVRDTINDGNAALREVLALDRLEDALPAFRTVGRVDGSVLTGNFDETLLQAFPGVGTGAHPSSRFHKPARIAVDGLYLYEAHPADGIVVHRIARPNGPSEVSSYGFPEGPAVFTTRGAPILVGHTLFYARHNELIPWDVADPSAPDPNVGAEPVCAACSYTGAIDAVADRLYLAHRNGVTSLRVDPDTTSGDAVHYRATQLKTFADGGARTFEAIRARYPYLYTIESSAAGSVSNARLVVFQELAGSYTELAGQDTLYTGSGGNYAAIGIYGDYLYVTAGGKGSVWVFSRATPSDPSLLTTLSVSGAFDLDVDGTRLYVSGFAGVTVFDLSTPGAPAQLGTGGDVGLALDASGEYVFSADEPLGSIIDVSDASAPATFGYGGTLNGQRGAFVLGKHMFLHQVDHNVIVELQ